MPDNPDYLYLSDYLFRCERYYPGCLLHWCPACGSPHSFSVDKVQSNGAMWKFNGTVDKPTFHPSMNISWGPGLTTPGRRVDRCHYWLKNGIIEFLPDSTHPLRGHTIPLPKLPERR